MACVARCATRELDRAFLQLLSEFFSWGGGVSIDLPLHRTMSCFTMLSGLASTQTEQLLPLRAVFERERYLLSPCAVLKFATARSTVGRFAVDKALLRVV